MDIYKSLINTLVEPICDVNESDLILFIENHRNGTEAERAVASLVERALNYILLTIASTENEVD